MKIKTLILGTMQTNCYVVNDTNNYCIIIDPGANGQKVRHYLEENELIPIAILLTHGHFDHIGAVDYLYNSYHCPVYIHQDDYEMLKNPQLNLSVFEKPFIVETPVSFSSNEIKLNNFELEWLHLPGHCPGSSMIYLKNNNSIFSGDVLFMGSIGRFDFPNSSKHDTMLSLDKIKNFDFDATVYPGHGECTTLSHELKNNPYLQKS